MNQILSIDNPKKEKTKTRNTRSNGPVDINSILKFFSIALLIFGVFMIGSGSYSMYKEVQKEGANTKPIIYVESVSETEILLKVTHNKPISQLSYQWNDEDAIDVLCDGKKEIETTIELPTGTNDLTVYASDANGQEIEYKRTYTVQGDITIDLEPEGNNLKIIANGEKTLTYMTYRWDEEEETRIDINATEIEEVIEIPRGLHKLTIIVVDENNQTETKEQDVNGVTKPKLGITTDGENFIINASDEQGLKRIEFIINEEERYSIDLYKVLSLEERKEFEYAYPLHDGENKIEVTVYNESEVTETYKALFNK